MTDVSMYAVGFIVPRVVLLFGGSEAGVITFLPRSALRPPSACGGLGDDPELEQVDQDSVPGLPRSGVGAAMVLGSSAATSRSVDQLLPPARRRLLQHPPSSIIDPDRHQGYGLRNHRRKFRRISAMKEQRESPDGTYARRWPARWGRTARRPRPGPAPARRGGLQRLERRQLIAVPLRVAGAAGLGMPGRRRRSQGPACRV